MKISTFPMFGAKNSREVFEAFECGSKNLGYRVSQHDFRADIYVIWSMLWINRMKENAFVWKTALQQNKPVIVLEIGALKRGETWKIGLGGSNATGYFANDSNLDSTRPNLLGLKLDPWKYKGNHILVCGQNSRSEQWRNYPPPDVWFRAITMDIRRVSQRPIILRPHPRDFAWAKGINRKDIMVKFPKKIQGTYDDYDHDNDFSNAWCVINPCSNPGIQSIIHGIPAFVDTASLAHPVGNNSLSKIEKPNRPKRTLWFEKICHTEWTLPEIEAGIPQQRLMTKALTNKI